METKISNRMVNELLVKSLRTNTLVGTWIDMEEVPKVMKEGHDVVMIFATKATLLIQVDELTRLMRRARMPYRHRVLVKGANALALAFEVESICNGKVCSCVSEENINVLKQIKADKHYRIF